MRIGVLVREVEWETARGRRVLVRSRRLASLADRHLAAIDYEVVALDGDAAVTICSELVTHAPAPAADDPRRGKGFAEKVLVPRDARTHGDGALLLLATRNSGLELGCGMTHTIDSPAQVTRRRARRGRRRPRRGAGRPGRRRVAAAVEVRRLPLGSVRRATRPARARRAHARPRCDGGLRGASKPRTAPRSRASGGAATSSSRAIPSSSRPCASTCSR